MTDTRTEDDAPLRVMVLDWTGAEIRALRETRRMSVREFAAHLGVSDRMVSKWEARPDMRPRPMNQAALDTSLSRVESATLGRFALILHRSQPGAQNASGRVFVPRRRLWSRREQRRRVTRDDAPVRPTRDDESRCTACGHPRSAHIGGRGGCVPCRPATGVQPRHGRCNRYRQPRDETEALGHALLEGPSYSSRGNPAGTSDNRHVFAKRQPLDHN